MHCVSLLLVVLAGSVVGTCTTTASKLLTHKIGCRVHMCAYIWS